MKKIHFTRRAREDLLDIWLYIAARNSETLADAIFDRIEEACARLAEYPELGRQRPEVAPEARVLIIERWLALYRLKENGVQIVRVFDGARDISTILWITE